MKHISSYFHKYDYMKLFERPSNEDLGIGMKERNRHLINRAMMNSEEKREDFSSEKII